MTINSSGEIFQLLTNRIITKSYTKKIDDDLIPSYLNLMS